MSEIRELRLNKDGRLVLEKDIIEALHLRDSKVQCVIHSDQIVLRDPSSVVEKLFGCWGEESKEDYDFHIEVERFGGPNSEGK